MSEIPGYVKMTAGAIREKAFQKNKELEEEFEKTKKKCIEFLLNWRKSKNQIICWLRGIPKDEKILIWYLDKWIPIDGIPEYYGYGMLAADWYLRTKTLSDSTEVFIDVDDARKLFEE